MIRRIKTQTYKRVKNLWYIFLAILLLFVCLRYFERAIKITRRIRLVNLVPVSSSGSVHFWIVVWGGSRLIYSGILIICLTMLKYILNIWTNLQIKQRRSLSGSHLYVYFNIINCFNDCPWPSRARKKKQF